MHPIYANLVSGKDKLKEKTFTHWIERIFETQEHEIDCRQLQNYLPSFIEAELGEIPLAHTAVLAAHLHQCPDCREVYDGLGFIMRLELDATATSPSSTAEEDERMPIGD